MNVLRIITVALLAAALLSNVWMHAREDTPKRSKSKPQARTSGKTSTALPATRLDKQEIAQFVAYHNKCRAEVGVGPLVWDDQLSRLAQDWANRLAATCELEHRKNNSYGENCAMNYEGTLTSGAVQWYEEKSLFRNVTLNESNWSPAGHYSQMIWRNTKKVGAGKARCRDGGWVIVANYDPPGNYMGQKAY